MDWCPIHRGVNTFCHFLLWKVGWALFRWTTPLHCWLSIYAFTGFHTMLPKSSDTGAGYISLWQWIKIGINLWYTPKFDPLKVKFMHSDTLISIYYWKYYCNFKGLCGVTDHEDETKNVKRGRLIDVWTDWQTDWLPDWLTDWQTDRHLTDW